MPAYRGANAVTTMSADAFRRLTSPTREPRQKVRSTPCGPLRAWGQAQAHVNAQVTASSRSRCAWMLQGEVGDLELHVFPHNRWRTRSKMLTQS